MGSGACDGVREGTGRAGRIQASLALGAFSALPRGRGRGTKAVVGAPWAGGLECRGSLGKGPPRIGLRATEVLILVCWAPRLLRAALADCSAREFGCV